MICANHTYIEAQILMPKDFFTIRRCIQPRQLDKNREAVAVSLSLWYNHRMITSRSLRVVP